MRTILHSSLFALALAVGLAGSISQAGAVQTETRSVTYSYDTNLNGVIDPEEFSNFVYRRSDVDNDGFLGDEEWELMSSYWYSPYSDIDTNTYTYWDQDKDQQLDSNEVDTLVEKTGLYSRWDSNMDGKVDTGEFTRGTFLAYDDNSDGSITVTEWEDVLR